MDDVFRRERMQIIYAPSVRQLQDALHCNAMCGYDIQILEALLQTRAKICYLPHKDTPDVINQIILDSVNATRVNSLCEVKSDALVSDTSNIVFEYAFLCKKPSIIALNGIVGIDFSDDRLHMLLQDIAYFAYSLKELRGLVTQLDFLSIESRICKFLQQEWL